MLTEITYDVSYQTFTGQSTASTNAIRMHFCNSNTCQIITSHAHL